MGLLNDEENLPDGIYDEILSRMFKKANGKYQGELRKRTGI